MIGSTIRIIPYIDINNNNVVKGTMFSDMTTIGSSSSLVNKHDVCDINKFHLFNVICHLTTK